jgi:hypothetical protein
MKLFESIGKSISKAKAPEAEAADAIDSPEEESAESPGAMLAEALNLKNADIEGIDAALKKAIEEFGS